MSYNSVTITDSATLIVGPNPDRISIIITNNSSSDIYLGEDSSVTASNGSVLKATTGSFAEDSGGTKCYVGPYYGIVGSGTANLRYWERTRKA